MSYLQNLSPMGVQPIRPPRIDDQTGALRAQMLRNQAAIENQARSINAQSYMQDRRQEADNIERLAGVLEKNPNAPIPDGLTKSQLAGLKGAQGLGVEEQKRTRAMNALTGNVYQGIQDFDAGKSVMRERESYISNNAPEEYMEAWLQTEAGKDLKKNKDLWNNIRSLGDMEGNDSVPQKGTKGMRILQEEFLKSQGHDLPNYLANYNADQLMKQNDRMQILQMLIRSGYHTGAGGYGGPATVGSASPSREEEGQNAIGKPELPPFNPNTGRTPSGNPLSGLASSHLGGPALSAIRGGMAGRGAFKEAARAQANKAAEIGREAAKGGIVGNDKLAAELKKENFDGKAPKNLSRKQKAEWVKDVKKLTEVQGKVLSANGIDPKPFIDNPKAMSEALTKAVNEGRIKKIPKGIDKAADDIIKKGILKTAAKKAGLSILGASSGGPAGFLIGVASATWTAWDVYNLLSPNPETSHQWR